MKPARGGFGRGEAPPAGELASNPAGDLPRTMLPANDKDTSEKLDRKKFLPPRFLVRKPGQRRADHGARRHDAEWRAYQAAWQKPIDELECNKDRFFFLRRHVLVLNRKQTARLLRVSINSVLNWEHGVYPVPFSAMLALLLISESMRYRLASEAWRDWEFSQRFNSDVALPTKARRHVTYLHNAKTGACFEPEELNRLHYTMQRIALLDSENIELRQCVAALTRENTELREMFLADGVTTELRGMRDRIQRLYERINTAAVIALPSKKAAGK